MSVQVRVPIHGLFLGAFAKLPEVTVSFFISVCLSVRPYRTSRIPLDVFSLYLIFEYFFKKPAEKSQVSLKSGENNGYFI